MPQHVDLEELRSWRRHLHQHPELSFEEHETTAYIEGYLRSLGLEPVRKTETGLWADIQGAHPGPTVAIRADIDALPIEEQTDLPFRSQKPGVMHACGHDGHTSILMGVAREFLARRQDLKGRIRLLFQPAEETPPGGAQLLIQAGALEGVDAVIGLHLIPAFPTGKASIVAGPMMAASDRFVLEVVGKGGHGASPHETVDALAIAAQMVTAAQQVVSRQVDPLEPAVVTFGTFHAGSNFNIIAQEARLTGTVRTFSEGTRQLIEGSLERIFQGMAQAYGAKVRLDYRRGYPALVNHPYVTDVFIEAVKEILGPEGYIPGRPVMGGEDFAYYLQQKPGAFLFLGCGNPAEGAIYPNHHPSFTIDEKALPLGVDVLVRTAEKLLAHPPRG